MLWMGDTGVTWEPGKNADRRSHPRPPVLGSEFKQDPLGDLTHAYLCLRRAALQNLLGFLREVRDTHEMILKIPPGMLARV